MVLYKNVSFSILKRLFTQVNVIMMIIFTMMNTASDAIRTANHAIMGYAYFLIVLCVICLDAIKVKSRAFILTFGLAFLGLTTYFWIGHVFLWDTRDKSQILFRGLRNEPLYKSAMKRWVFSQLIIFSCKGLKTLLLDRNGEYLLFVTSNIFRDSGEYDDGSVSNTQYDDNVAGDAPEDRSSIEKHSSDCNRKNYANGTKSGAKRESVVLFGREEVMDDNVIKRVKKIEMAAAITAFVGITAYIIIQILKPTGILNIICAGIVYSAAAVAFCLLFGVLYKNISYPILMRLLREFNVWVIIISAILNFVIEVIWPVEPYLDPVAAFVFLFMVVYLIALDCAIFKQRNFLLLYAFAFVFTCTFVIYKNSIGDDNLGILLFEQSKGIGSTYYKRYIKRSIFVQTLGLGLSAIKTMYWDKDMSLIMFCKGPVFVKTGTTSKFHVDRDRSATDVSMRWNKI